MSPNLPREIHKAKIFDGNSFLCLDAGNADSVNFIFFRVWNNTLEVQFCPSGRKEDLQIDLWVPVVDMSVTTLEALKKKLQDLINECYTLVNSVSIGDAIGQWKQAVVSTFITQIKNAEVPLLSPTPTVLELSNALSTLQENKRKFEQSKNTIVSLAKDKLYQLIMICKALYDESGNKLGESLDGFYDPDEREVFQKHINTAWYVYNDASANERQVNQAYDILLLAYNNFKNSVLSGVVNTAELSKSIAKAEKALSNATVMPEFGEITKPTRLV